LYLTRWSRVEIQYGWELKKAVPQDSPFHNLRLRPAHKESEADDPVRVPLLAGRRDLEARFFRRVTQATLARALRSFLLRSFFFGALTASPVRQRRRHAFFDAALRWALVSRKVPRTVYFERRFRLAISRSMSSFRRLETIT